MVRRINSDMAWGTGLLLFCLVVTLLILDQPAGDSVRGAPGARFFPLLLVGSMSVLGVALTVSGIGSLLDGKERAPIDWRRFGGVATAAVGMFAYVYVMSHLRGWARNVGIFFPRGTVFALTTALFLFVFFRYLGERRWQANAALTLAITGVLYVGFISMLDVRFP